MFDLINFDGSKVVQVSGETIEVYHTNLTCMLCNFHGANTFFGDIGKLEFAKNIIRDSKLLHQVFGGKFHHCYAFVQKLLVNSIMERITTSQPRLRQCLVLGTSDSTGISYS